MFYKRDKIEKTFSKSHVTSAPLLPLYCFMISRMSHKQGSYLKSVFPRIPISWMRGACYQNGV